MTEARLQMFGLQATWPMIAELGWLSPGRLTDLLHRSEDPLLSALVRKFEADFEGAGDADGAAWFAAWALTERPGVAKHASAAQPAQHSVPERAFRVLVELLGLDHQGRQRDIVERRTRRLVVEYRNLYRRAFEEPAMKTTLDLNDALLTRAKALAAQQRTSLTRLIEEGLQLRLRAQRTSTKPVRLPIYRGKGGLASGLDGTSNKAMLDAADQDS
jgi:hypothetical protein